MTYRSGKPTFSVEKPTKLLWDLKTIKKLEDSKEWVGELKIDEHRGQLCFEEDTFGFYSYRGTEHEIDDILFDQLEILDLPVGTVLDGGYFKINGKTYAYVFDILLYKGEKVWKSYQNRMLLLGSLINQDFLNRLFPVDCRILLPVKTTKFVEHFQEMIDGDSSLIQLAAKFYGFEYEDLSPFVEGFVFKKLSGFHSYPVRVKKSDNFYKLRLEDLPKGMVK